MRPLRLILAISAIGVARRSVSFAERIEPRFREDSKPSELEEAAREALAAYRASFSTCWNQRDRAAFARLERALPAPLPEPLP